MKYISLAGPSMNKANCYTLPLDSSFPGMILPESTAVVLQGAFGRIFLQDHELHDLRISSYFLEIKQQAALYPTASNGISALYFGTRGDFSIQLNNERSISMQAGSMSLFYLPANQQQQSYFNPGQYELLYLTLSEQFLQSIAELHTGLRSFYEAVSSKITQVWYGQFLPMNARVWQLLSQIIDSTTTPLSLRAYVTDIIAEYFRLLEWSSNRRGEALKGQEVDKMVRIADYIEQNLAEDISVHQLSRLAAMNSYTFSQHFKKAFTVSPSEFILQRRIHAAEILLRESDLSIEEIAYRTGFSDRSHFYKAFKKIHHCSPLRFRNRY